MHRRAFANADGDLLIIPQYGTLRITTELGRLQVAPGEICVIPRNIRFAVNEAPSHGPTCRGYACELRTGHFRLPELGPIGANGLAEVKH